MNVMVIGESGLGKSTLINAMFMTDIYVNIEAPARTTTMSIQRTSVYLEEKGVRLRLSLIDTPGFGAAADNTNSFISIVAEVDRCFEQYLDEEARIHRSSIIDNRIHVCLYFLAPTGRGIKALDLEVLKHLHQKVNIIPIIGRSDAMTAEETSIMKSKVLSDLASNGIEITRLSQGDDDDEMQPQPPFAVCSSTAAVRVEGRATRGRTYPWGTVDADSAASSDFHALRTALLRTHTRELIDTTDVHYENFRASRLGEVTTSSDTVSNTEETILVKIEQEKEMNIKRLESMEAEMSHVFGMKVREREQRLRDKEAAMARQHEDMQMDLQNLQRQVEQKRLELLTEKTAIRERSMSMASSSKDKKSQKSFV